VVKAIIALQELLILIPLNVLLEPTRTLLIEIQEQEEQSLVSNVLLVSTAKKEVFSQLECVQKDIIVLLEQRRCTNSPALLELMLIYLVLKPQLNASLVTLAISVLWQVVIQQNVLSVPIEAQQELKQLQELQDVRHVSQEKFAIKKNRSILSFALLDITLHWEPFHARFAKLGTTVIQQVHLTLFILLRSVLQALSVLNKHRQIQQQIQI